MALESPEKHGNHLKIKAAFYWDPLTPSIMECVNFNKNQDVTGGYNDKSNKYILQKMFLVTFLLFKQQGMFEPSGA